jgi:D-beta-D-heptose 7-phosphate kinase/D-beta-D-heptose 1-phosphate adenosyltransferase
LKSKLKRFKRVVFTNGCFDLLHPGHVETLERAKRLGDCLVVAVNSDPSVRRLKGPGRPVNPLAARLRVIAGLEAVDYVTFFGEDTPLETILALRPHVLVKGGDYSVATMVGAREIKSWGGTVKALPFVRGFSTTRIIAGASGRKKKS